MVFWILIGIIVVVTIISGIYHYFDGYSDIESGVIGAAGGFFASSICSILVLLVCWTGVFISTPDAATATEDNNNKKEKYQLRSIGGGDTVEGQYYIAGQIIDGERYITYMYSKPEKNKNRVVMAEVEVDNALINIEETDEPYVQVTTSTVNIGWLFPWADKVENNSVTEFFIPEGTILGDYSLIGLNDEAKDW